jgi:hypothetical protein
MVPSDALIFDLTVSIEGRADPRTTMPFGG